LFFPLDDSERIHIHWEPLFTNFGKETLNLISRLLCVAADFYDITQENSKAPRVLKKARNLSRHLGSDEKHLNAQWSK
jgi:hypothetical protein